jgi:hypothetical protein
LKRLADLIQMRWQLEELAAEQQAHAAHDSLERASPSGGSRAPSSLRRDAGGVGETINAEGKAGAPTHRHGQNRRIFAGGLEIVRVGLG